MKTNNIGHTLVIINIVLNLLLVGINLYDGTPIFENMVMAMLWLIYLEVITVGGKQ